VLAGANSTQEPPAFRRAVLPFPGSVPGAVVGLAGTVPEEVEAAVAVDDQVGEDRLGQARIVNTDLMVVVAGLLRGLGPGGTQFDVAGVEAEGRSVLGLAFNRFEGRLSVEGEGLDCALEEAVLSQREGADRRHLKSPSV